MRLKLGYQVILKEYGFRLQAADASRYEPHTAIDTKNKEEARYLRNPV